MNKFALSLLSAAWLAISLPLSGAEQPTKIAVVNFKQCLEKSKWGQQEQEKFNNLKNQIQEAMESKEKTIKEVAAKLNDPDYLDSLSPEAEDELKQQYQKSAQEIGAMQQQTYQMLNQANYQILQATQGQVNEAAKTLAEANHYDFVLNEENCFFFSSAHDITDKVVAEMDRMYEKMLAEQGEAKTVEKQG